ncbi:HAMP domain-containing sensor histidine kinase [Dyadobacter sp. SG02]|uniref:sensor histidine kinase n=1 Tax=Dyadobacter sp. SG02 TaxID=1855291 RepID=UPI0015A5B4C9|nr:HAMP domain-containing sensor histidine kinase [Dyadobacter sp. SG02]
MWLATEGGLTRFDGRNFRVFGKDHKAASSNAVWTISPGRRNSSDPSKLDVAYVTFATGNRANIRDGKVYPVGDEVLLRDEKVHALRAKDKFDFVNGLPERWGRVINADQSTMVASNFGDGEFYLCGPTAVAYYRDWQRRYQVPNKIGERMNYFTLGGRLYYLNSNKSFTQIYDNKKSLFSIGGDLTGNESYAKNKTPVKLFWNNKTAQAFFYIDGQVFEITQQPEGTLTTRLLISYSSFDSDSIDIIYHDRKNRKVFLAGGKGLFVKDLTQADNIGPAGETRPAVSPSQNASSSTGDFVLDQVVAGDRVIEPNHDTIRLSKSVNLEVFLSAAYFEDQGDLNMTYCLAEPDQETSSLKWQQIKEQDGKLIIRYPSLPSGIHKLIIRRQTDLQKGIYKTKEIVISIPKAWYERTWPQILSIALLLILGFLMWRMRFRQIEHRNRLLEIQVSERTDELRQILLTLEISRNDLMQQFHLQSRLLTSMAHDLRSPLSSAVLVTSEVGRLLGRQEIDKAVHLNSQLENAIRLIKQSTDELLTYMKVQVYNTEVKMEEIALAGVVDRSFHLYAKTARANSNIFQNNVPQDARVFTNPQLLHIIIRNLTDNANKYTENGTIYAEWSNVNGAVSLSVRDTGSGLPSAIVEWFRQDGPLAAPDKLSGLGLIIVKELAPFAKVRLGMRSGNDGTNVTLTFSDQTHFM